MVPTPVTNGSIPLTLSPTSANALPAAAPNAIATLAPAHTAAHASVAQNAAQPAPAAVPAAIDLPQSIDAAQPAASAAPRPLLKGLSGVARKALPSGKLFDGRLAAATGSNNEPVFPPYFAYNISAEELARSNNTSSQRDPVKLAAPTAALPSRAGFLEIVEQLTALRKLDGFRRASLESLVKSAQARRDVPFLAALMLISFHDPQTKMLARQALQAVATRVAVQGNQVSDETGEDAAAALRLETHSAGTTFNAAARAHFAATLRSGIEAYLPDAPPASGQALAGILLLATPAPFQGSKLAGAFGGPVIALSFGIIGFTVAFYFLLKSRYGVTKRGQFTIAEILGATALFAQALWAILHFMPLSWEPGWILVELVIAGVGVYMGAVFGGKLFHRLWLPGRLVPLASILFGLKDVKPEAQAPAPAQSRPVSVEQEDLKDLLREFIVHLARADNTALLKETNEARETRLRLAAEDLSQARAALAWLEAPSAGPAESTRTWLREFLTELNPGFYAIAHGARIEDGRYVLDHWADRGPAAAARVRAAREFGYRFLAQ